MENDWVCRLLLLGGKEPWEQVQFAYLDDRHYGVRFTQVEDGGTIRGELVPRSSC